MNEKKEVLSANSVEERLDVLEDKEAIRDVLSRYALTVDLRQFDDFLDLWTPNGVFVTDGPGDIIRKKGRQEIKEFLERFLPVEMATQHLQLDYVIEVNGDTATAIGYQLISETQANASRIGRCALRKFRFCRFGGNWLIDEAVSRAVSNLAECRKLAAAS